MSLFKCWRPNSVRQQQQRIEKAAIERLRRAEENEEQNLVADLAAEVDELSDAGKAGEADLFQIEKVLHNEWIDRKIVTDNLLQVLEETRTQIALARSTKKELESKISGQKETARFGRAADEEETIIQTAQLTAALEKTRKDAEEKISAEVSVVEVGLKKAYEDARIRLEELQKKIIAEQEAFLAITVNIDQDKKLLETAATKTVEVKEKDQQLNVQRAEIEKLQQENEKLMKNIQKLRSRVEKAEKEGLIETVRGPRRRGMRREPSEIQVRPTGCPRMSVLGSNVDSWLDRTSHNLNACCESFGPSQTTQYVSNPPDGILCEICCCSAGSNHNRRRCRICHALDLSDVTMLP